VTLQGAECGFQEGLEAGKFPGQLLVFPTLQPFKQREIISYSAAPRAIALSLTQLYRLCKNASVRQGCGQNPLVDAIATAHSLSFVYNFFSVILLLL
jgi:hypothetical protein